MRRRSLIFCTLVTALVGLFLLDIAVGSVNLSLSDLWNGLTGRADLVVVKIVRDIRLIKAIVAIIVGICLSVSGLMMQTLFRNPLAGPYVLGLSSGASLGVALFILGMPLLGISSGGFISSIGVAGSAWLGSAIVLLMLSVLSTHIKDIMVILILGMCFSSGISAIVEIMQYLSDEQSLKSFVVWTMGSLGSVTYTQLAVMLPAVCVGMLLSVSAVKPLNILLLGEGYARSMGLDLVRSRMIVLVSTTLLAGSVTAFCGPVGFIGIVVPHLARWIFRSADHRVLLPASALCGGILMLLCDIVSKWLTLPINSVTALAGIPAVVWIVMKSKSIS